MIYKNFFKYTALLLFIILSYTVFLKAENISNNRDNQLIKELYETWHNAVESSNIDGYINSLDKNITLIPNAVTLEHTQKAPFYDFKLPNGTLLLCLSRYYPLKNLEIFIPLAEEIKKKGLDYKIIITVDESQHRKVKPFLSLMCPISISN